MTRTPRVAIGLVLALLLASHPAAQQPTLEYRVKAAYLLNFMRYVEWPDGALPDGPLTLCVAGRNPFGAALEETVRGERIADRDVAVRVLLEPEDGCAVLFVPRGANTAAYLRAARGTPVLTVGEIPDFLAQGGIINLVLDGGNVRFEIDQQAATRVQLQISSRLLRLASPPTPGGTG
jgi:hypothetical protein